MADKIVFLVRAMLTLWLLTVGSLLMLVSAILTGFQAPRLYRETIGANLGRLALRILGIDMRVLGPVPDGSRQVVYVSNHTSTLDVFALISLGLPNTRFFLSGFLRKLLPMGLIGYLIGNFWTVPQSFPEKRRIIFMNAERVLRRTGESVYLSPEGERIVTGEIGHFNKGSFHLATMLRAPIVPIYIRIPREINPGKGLHSRPGTIEVFFREPVETASWRVEDLEHNRDRVRELFVDWHDQLRTPEAAQ